MRVHHLNCTTLCPRGGRLMDGRPRATGPAELVCHCLLVETERGLVLVDTGFGLNDVRDTRARIDRFFRWLLRPRLHEEETALRQVEALGFRQEDVRHIVLTHLDFDHAGGLDDFPEARIHLLAAERDAAFRQAMATDRRRFRPRQWGSSSRWLTYSAQGEPWFGFEAVRELEGLPPELLLVPLTGHTLGHAGVALAQEGRWLLHAGDAYFFHGEVDTERPHCPPGLRGYQRMMETNRTLRLWNQERLRQLLRRNRQDVRVFCAHDPVEYEQQAGLFRPEPPPVRFTEVPPTLA